MGRKPNPLARPYNLTPEARGQRRQAATERWNAITDPEVRRAILKPAYSITPGRPRKASAPKVLRKRGRPRKARDTNPLS